MDGEQILGTLNSQQAEAVTWCDGPELVIAGAGSGKTRVLASKIAYLIAEKRVPPNRILALTFTNKAASEMLERVKHMVGDDLHGMQVSTFHSWGLRFLYRNARTLADLGYTTTNLVIYDRGDCRNLVKKITRQLGFDLKHDDNVSFIDKISKAYANCDPLTLNPDIEEKWRPMYDSYRIGLRQQGALDFDDLMILPLHILLNNRDILESERARIEWTLVDEYQDVNIPQYTLLRTLVGDSGRLMVVGDPDQSIYGWRGSDMSLILNFESDFRGARAITLDRNYRSTTNILASANSVIQNNNERHDKKLWTNAEGGAPVQVMLSLRDIDDFKFITNEISHLVFEDGYEYSDIGILYRMNALSRGYEQALLENGIHYSIVRGVSYYDRKEVKDVLSMLRLSVNPHDEASLSRIVNVPKRGLGEKSAAELGRYLATACGDPRRIWEEIKLNPPLKGKAGAGASKLAEIMLGIAEEKSLEGAVNFILYNAGYEEYIREEYPDDWEDRLQNAREFISIIPESGSVSEALAQAALFTDHDAADTRNSGVSLMTLHAAKGLEFPVVFLVGLEENIFPSERSKFNPGGIEEERRLCYVGMTRARERLYITGVVNRLLFGAFRRSNFSRFISELPDTVTIVDRTKNGSGKDVHGGSDRRGWRW